MCLVFPPFVFENNSSSFFSARVIYNIFVAFLDEIENVIFSKGLKFKLQSFYPFRSMFGMIENESFESQSNGFVRGFG